MDTDSFIVHVQTDDIQKDTVEDVKTRFDTSNYELSKPFSKGKSKKSTGLMKDELGGKIMTYSYLIDDDSKDKKAKGTKKCVIKRKRKIEDYKNCVEAAQLENKINHLEKNKIDVNIHNLSLRKYKLILKTQQRFRNEKCNVFAEEINKIALSSNDDKRIQSIDSIETCTYRASKNLACRKEEIKFNDIIKQ